MWATGNLRRQIPAHVAKRVPLRFPSRQAIARSSPPGPLVEIAQHRRGLADAEIGTPSNEIARQLLRDVPEGRALDATRKLPDVAAQWAAAAFPALEVQAFDGAPSPLCPLLTSAPRSGRLTSISASNPRHRRTSPELNRPSCRTPAGLTRRAVNGRRLRDHLLPRPAGYASLSSSCHGPQLCSTFLQTPSRDDALALR